MLVYPLNVSVFAAAVSLSTAACGDMVGMEGARSVCEELRTVVIAPSQCGPSLDLTRINSYRGEIAAVQEREEAVVLIDGDCTGTLVAAAAGPVVATAGHCVGLGDPVLLAFNVEADPDGDQLVTNGTVIEQRVEPDYALIELDELPATTPTPLTTQPSDVLAVIQYPRGGPKSIAEGNFAGSCGGQLFYAVDTVVGSSGAGVLNREGYLLGIHTDGQCAEDGSGFNFGWTAASIVQASSYLQDADLDGR
jgi:hypothetical protein